MPNLTRRGPGVALVLLAAAVPAAAQPSMRGYLDARLGKQSLSISYGGTSAAEVDTDQPGADFRFQEHDLYLSVPVSQSEAHEWTFAASLRALDFQTDVLLPDTREGFPNVLWDVGVGTTYRFRTPQGWTAGANLRIHSPSDHPFSSEDEVVVEATGFVRIPHVRRNAWLLLLNYSNEREFLEHVPLPGVAYQFGLGPNFQATVGIPFLFARWKPVDRLTLTARYVLPRTVHAEAAFSVVEGVDAYVGYDWRNQHYLRTKRMDEDDRLTLYEQRVRAGVRWELLPRLSVDAFGGYGFNRFIYEGEEYDDRDENRINLRDGPFGGIEIALRF